MGSEKTVFSGLTMKEFHRAKIVVEEDRSNITDDPYEHCNIVLARKILFIFDVLMAIAGVRLVYIGFKALEDYHVYDYFFGMKMGVLPVSYIFFGFIAFVLTFWGCFGTFTKDPYTMVSFSLGILGCVLLQILAGFFTLYHRFFFKNPMRATLKASMAEYNLTSSEFIYNVWEDMQRKFECCGVDSPRDWMPYFSVSSVPVPLSCCANYEEKKRKGEKCYARLNESSFQLGCYTQLQTTVAQHFNWMLLSGVAPTLTEMVGLMLTLIIAKAIKTDMILRKIRPWSHASLD